MHVKEIVILMDTNSAEWKEKMKKIREQVIKKEGCEEKPQLYQAGYHKCMSKLPPK